MVLNVDSRIRLPEHRYPVSACHRAARADAGFRKTCTCWVCRKDSIEHCNVKTLFSVADYLYIDDLYCTHIVCNFYIKLTYALNTLVTHKY